MPVENIGLARSRISVLRKDLKSAEDRGDREAASRLQQELFLLLLVTSYGVNLRVTVSDYADRIRDAILDKRYTEFQLAQRIYNISRQMNGEVIAEFGRQLDRIARDEYERQKSLFKTTASPELLRSASGLPVDQVGNFAPQPGETPGPMLDDEATLEEILIHIAPLLFVTGSKSQVDPEIIKEPDFDTIINRSRGYNWTVNLSLLFAATQPRLVASLIAGEAKDGNETGAIQRSKNWLGVSNDTRGGVGYSRRVQQELNHEGMRVKNDIIAQIIEDNLNRAYVGYILKSRFWPTTDPIHAGNDGNQYYIDNRPGSSASWVNRLYPPYRKNCVCYTISLYDENGPSPTDGDGSTSLPGTDGIVPRDAETLNRWIAAQGRLVQRTFFGEDRWDELKSFGNINYASVLNDDLQVLPAGQISQNYHSRKNRVEAILAQDSIRHRRSWTQYDVSVTPSEESANRRLVMARMRGIV